MKTLLSFFLSLLSIYLPAQQKIISTQGEVYTNNNISLSFTIGEGNILCSENNFIKSSEGFHQTIGTYYPLPNDCEELNLSLSQTSEPSGIYSAEQKITSTSILSSNSSVSYVAGQSIILEPGFHAPLNSNFLGTVFDCTPSTSFVQEDVKYVEQLISVSNKVNNTFSISPNPTRDFLELTFNLEKASLTQIHFFHSTGKRIRFWNLGVLQKGPQFKRLSNLSIPKGIYYLSLVTNQSMITKSILVINQ